MPIHCPVEFRNLTQAEFDERDRAVMRCAYAAQNKLGRLCDERVYENDVARRLRAEGFSSVLTQVPISVTHDGFVKEYKMDLLVSHALYELKTTATLAPQHETQALHYAMLLDVNHTKLLNFRSAKVQGRLLFNTFLSPRRTKVEWDDGEWRSISPQCDTLKLRVRALIQDWGGCLETQLYEEALIYFCGGESKCRRRVPVMADAVELGTHLVTCHGDGFGFLVTAFTSGIDVQRSHIRRLLAITNLRAIQWINVNRTIVQLNTVTKELPPTPNGPKK